jgi:urease accessory protein
MKIMPQWSGITAGFLLLAALSAPAFAHPGHLAMSGFAAGALHPLTGLDHLAAMLMVGVWAGTAFPRHLFVPPLAFMGFMLLGFGYGVIGGGLPIAEMLILASVIVLGLAGLFEIHTPLAIACGTIALFAFAHGFAHGSEMPHEAGTLGFVAGFTLVTGLLHAAGVGIAALANRPVARLIGGGSAALGMMLIFAT